MIGLSDERAAARHELVRMVEALLFASASPLTAAQLAERLPPGTDVGAIVGDLAKLYAHRGVNLVRVGGGYAFRTAPDLGHLLKRDAVEPRRLSRAALETLSIIAYHQPVTRAEIEAIRGVATSRGTLDVLMEAGFIRMRGRRRAPGRPVTYGTTLGFLEHFGLESVADLPGLDELKAAGLLDMVPPSAAAPAPAADDEALAPDEEPLEDGARPD